MFRKVLSLILAMGLLLSASALGEHQAETVAGETFYPDRENWTYRYDYEMPQLVCEEGDTAAMAVNAALQTVLDEMLYLILPMLSRTETVTGVSVKGISRPPGCGTVPAAAGASGETDPPDEQETMLHRPDAIARGKKVMIIMGRMPPGECPKESECFRPFSIVRPV